MYNDEIEISTKQAVDDGLGGFANEDVSTILMWGRVLFLGTRYEKKQAPKGLGIAPMQRVRSIQIETWYREDIAYSDVATFMSINYNIVDIIYNKENGTVKYTCETVI